MCAGIEDIYLLEASLLGLLWALSLSSLVFSFTLPYLSSITFYYFPVLEKFLVIKLLVVTLAIL